MNMKKLTVVMTALVAVASLASCSRKPKNPSSSTTSGQPTEDWSEESKKVFEENLLFSLPYVKGAEAQAEGGIVHAEGSEKVDSTAVDDYCALVEAYEEEWEEEVDGENIKFRSIVTALADISPDADYYFNLSSAAEYRISIEYYDTDDEDWYPGYYVEQDIYFGLSSAKKFNVYSVVNYNIYGGVFGVSFDGTSGYMPSIYAYFDTNDTTADININTFAEIEFSSADGKKTQFDGEFITPEFNSDEEYAMVLPVDYQYIYPYLYGNSTDPIFSTYLGLVYGSEEEHDDYITALEAKGYTEVEDEERVEEGTRLFEKTTKNGVCEISVDEYSEEQFEFELGVLPGYGFCCTFYLN